MKIKWIASVNFMTDNKMEITKSKIKYYASLLKFCCELCTKIGLNKSKGH